MSAVVATSFALANSLISADVLSVVYKNTLSKVIFDIICDKNSFETENISFARRISCKKTKNDNKKIRVGNPNLGTFGNRKHTYFLLT